MFKIMPNAYNFVSLYIEIYHTLQFITILSFFCHCSALTAVNELQNEWQVLEDIYYYKSTAI